jgi:hypothetical protein
MTQAIRSSIFRNSVPSFLARSQIFSSLNTRYREKAISNENKREKIYPLMERVHIRGGASSIFFWFSGILPKK